MPYSASQTAPPDKGYPCSRLPEKRLLQAAIISQMKSVALSLATRVFFGLKITTMPLRMVRNRQLELLQ
jgi:hypothetical protein